MENDVIKQKTDAYNLKEGRVSDMKNEQKLVLLHHIATFVSLFLCGIAWMKESGGKCRKGAFVLFAAVQLFACGKIAAEATGLKKQTLLSKVSDLKKTIRKTGKSTTAAGAMMVCILLFPFSLRLASLF